MTTAPTELERPDVGLASATDVPWITIVWNDPVNLMSYVTYVFMTYFKYSREKAEKLMMQVHQDGRSVVSSGSREEMERDVSAMHSYGLWRPWPRTTLERAWIPADGDGAHRAAGVDAVEKGLLVTLLEQLADFVAPEDLDDEDPLVAMVGLDRMRCVRRIPRWRGSSPMPTSMTTQRQRSSAGSLSARCARPSWPIPRRPLRHCDDPARRSPWP